MIFKRFAANLRAQNWFAITVELLIVVVGVFIGTWVANWNEERLERAETARMLDELVPQLQRLAGMFESFEQYFRTTKDYGDVAFAGWAGDTSVSDRDFVIGAYQASQITTSGINNNSWAAIFGSERLRDLDDPELKSNLAQLMTIDYAVTERDIYTEYRESVRRVIPQDIQEAIREQCGDRRNTEIGFVRLSQKCEIDMADDRFRIAAQRLRANPELADELRWHFAAVATFLENMAYLKLITGRILERIEDAA